MRGDAAVDLQRFVTGNLTGLTATERVMVPNVSCVEAMLAVVALNLGHRDIVAAG